MRCDCVVLKGGGICHISSDDITTCMASNGLSFDASHKIKEHHFRDLFRQFLIYFIIVYQTIQ